MEPPRSSDEGSETSDEEYAATVHGYTDFDHKTVIPSELLSEQELLHYLSLKPQRNQVWRKLPGRGVFSSVKRAADTSSLGTLDEFPVEVLNMIFENLDLQSLSRVLQTCLKGKIIVEKLPAYRDLMTYASDIFTALSQMGIIHVHSASTIHAALRTDRCVVCGEYGENLFLPTCDRACQACHCSNYAFWTIPVDGPTGASMVFNLGPDHFKSVLNFCSFGEPDEYGQRRSMRRNTGSRPQRPKSITSKVAMDLGIEANGSEEGLASHMQSYFPALKSRASRGFRNHVLQHPADELASHILSWNQRAHYDNVFRYSGPCASNFAVIYFPSLVNNTLDLGRLCYGCNKALVNNWKSHGRRAWVRDLLKQHRVRSKAEFLEHVKNCSRAKALVVELLRRRKENDAASIADENWFKRSHHSEVFNGCENTWLHRHPGCAQPQRKEGGRWEVENSKLWSL